jgi:hypothetical protein
MRQECDIRYTMPPWVSDSNNVGGIIMKYAEVVFIGSFYFSKSLIQSPLRHHLYFCSHIVGRYYVVTSIHVRRALQRCGVYDCNNQGRFSVVIRDGLLT